MDKELLYVYADMCRESLQTNMNIPNNQVEKGHTHTRKRKYKVNTSDFLNIA